MMLVHSRFRNVAWMVGLSLATSHAWAVTAVDDQKVVYANGGVYTFNVLSNDPRQNTSNTLVCVNNKANCSIPLENFSAASLVAPAHGTVQVNGESIVYTPNVQDGDPVADSFEYAVYQGEDSNVYDVATVTISVADPAEALGIGKNIATVADTVLDLCRRANSNGGQGQYSIFLQSCATLNEALNNGDTQAISNLLSSLTPEEITAQYTTSVQATDTQRQNIGYRLSELKSGATGASLSGLMLNQGQQQLSGQHLLNSPLLGGASGDQANFSRLGFFINGSISEGDRDSTDLERTYDLESDNVTVGADYRFSDRFIAGAAYGFSDQSLEFSGNQDDMENETDNLMVYSTWFKNGFYADVLLGYAEGDISTHREISLVNSIAQGTTTSEQVFFSITGNYDFNQGPWTYGPFASFDITDGTIDAYSETQGGGWEVAFDEQDIESRVMTMGARTAYAYSAPWGVISPHARVEAKKEFNDDRDFITGRFALDPDNATFGIEAEQKDDQWYQASVGFSATFQHGLSAFADYEQLIDFDDLNLNTYTVGGRWEAQF